MLSKKKESVMIIGGTRMYFLTRTLGSISLVKVSISSQEDDLLRSVLNKRTIFPPKEYH